jgi:hypothetical protein
MAILLQHVISNVTVNLCIPCYNGLHILHFSTKNVAIYQNEVNCINSALSTQKNALKSLQTS